MAYQVSRPIFDEHAPARQANESKGARIFRSADNPNEIVVLFEWDSLENARKFSDESKQVMQRAGVSGIPDFYLIVDAR